MENTVDRIRDSLVGTDAVVSPYPPNLIGAGRCIGIAFVLFTDSTYITGVWNQISAFGTGN